MSDTPPAQRPVVSLPPRARSWPLLGEHNVDRWGEQSPMTLALTLAEEQGEIADEILRSAAPGEDLVASQAFDLLRQVREIGFACRSFLEDEFEDGSGVPIPPEDRPGLDVEIDEEATLDEVDDVGPLVYQLAWALEERDRDE